MSDTPYQDCSPSLYGGELPAKRSHGPFLWYLEAFPEQRSSFTADDVPHFQRTSKLGVGRDHDDTEYHERHWSWERCFIQGERNQGIV